MSMTIEEALNQAELLAAEDEWVALTQYEITPHSTDAKVYIDLDNRLIEDMSENVSTIEETNSEYILFSMDRYHDGIDLTKTRIQIQYNVQGINNISGVVNAFYNSSQIKFGWVVPEAATRVATVIEVMVFCTGLLEDDETYLLKTLPARYKIGDTLMVGGTVPEPVEDWYLQFVASMDQRVVEAANSASSAKTSADSAKLSQSTASAAEVAALSAATSVQSNTEIVTQKAEEVKNYTNRAETAAKNAEAVTGVSIGTEELAGLLRGGDALVDETGAVIHIKSTSERTLFNSKDSLVHITDIYGKTEQKTTLGNQLFDATALYENTAESVTVSEDTYTITVQSSAGVVSASSCAFAELDVSRCAGKTIHIALDSFTSTVSSVGQNVQVVYNLASGAYKGSTKLYESGTSTTFDIPSDATRVRIYIAAKNVSSSIPKENTLTVTGLRVTLVEGEWEPFTNGPTPNPLYPQEIKSVVLSKIRSCGKNQLKSVGLTTQTTNGGTFTPVYDNNNKLQYVNVNGTFTEQATYNLTWLIDNTYNGKILTGCNGGSYSTYSLLASYYDENTKWKGEQYETGNGLVINSSYPTMTFGILVRKGVTVNNVKFYPMIRDASITDATYEPYTESIVTLPEPITLNGIGGVQDYIDAKRGVLVQKYKERIFNGSENGWAASGSVVGRFLFTSSGCAKDSVYAKSTQFIASKYSATLKKNTFFLSSGDSLGFDTGFSTLTEWKTHLASKPMKVTYALAEPIETPLPDADVEALKSLKTYDGVTHIFTDSEVEPTIDMDYGTSKVGAAAIEALLTAQKNEIRLKRLEAASTEEV